jgi:hypothetical protein
MHVMPHVNFEEIEERETEIRTAPHLRYSQDLSGRHHSSQCVHGVCSTFYRIPTCLQAERVPAIAKEKGQFLSGRRALLYLDFGYP